jgi:uncharacterized repeat protein (TIGR01451 family)
MVLDRRILSIALLLAAGVLAIYVFLLGATTSGAQTGDPDITGIDDDCETSVETSVIDEVPTYQYHDETSVIDTVNDQYDDETSVIDDVADNHYDDQYDAGSDCETSVIDGPTELNVNKIDNPDPVEVGDFLLYTIVVRNAGNEVATNVVLEDDLPNSVDFIALDSSQGDCEEVGGKVVCVLGPLEPDEQDTVQIFVEPEEEGTITNIAQVFSEDTLVDESRENTRVVGDEVTDATPPTVASVKPSDKKTGVKRGTTLKATFSEEMNPDTLTDSTVFLVNTKTGGAVKAKVSCDDPCTTVVTNPWTRMARNTKYKAIITRDAEDLVGNSMAKNKTWTFTTGAR